MLLVWPRIQLSLHLAHLNIAPTNFVFILLFTLFVLLHLLIEELLAQTRRSLHAVNALLDERLEFVGQSSVSSTGQDDCIL